MKEREQKLAYTLVDLINHTITHSLSSALAVAMPISTNVAGPVFAILAARVVT
jgi:hypothetical protein